jgi:hypothetical protein
VTDEREHRRGRRARTDFDPDVDDVYEDLPPPFPAAFTRNGRAVPDLAAIPRDDWADVLRWCTPWERELALSTPRTHDERVAARIAVLELEGQARSRRHAALRTSAPPPVPEVPEVPKVPKSIARRPGWRQVNFRLAEDDYTDLDRAARAYGVSAPRLAMMFTVRGVKRALGDP